MAAIASSYTYGTEFVHIQVPNTYPRPQIPPKNGKRAWSQLQKFPYLLCDQAPFPIVWAGPGERLPNTYIVPVTLLTETSQCPATYTNIPATSSNFTGGLRVRNSCVCDKERSML